MKVLKFTKREHLRNQVQIGDIIKFNFFQIEMSWLIIKKTKDIKAFCLNNGKISKLMLNGPMESYSLIRSS